MDDRARSEDYNPPGEPYREQPYVPPVGNPETYGGPAYDSTPNGYQQGYGPTTPGAYGYPYGPQPVPPTPPVGSADYLKTTAGQSAAFGVSGLVAFVLSFFLQWLIFFPLILSIVAVYLGKKAKTKGEDAQLGITTGWIGIALTGGLLLLTLGLFAMIVVIFGMASSSV